MPPRVWVGTTNGLYEIGGDQRIQLTDHEVRSLVRDDSGWWAIIDRREVWRSGSDDDWRQVTSMETLRAICLLPTALGLFVGTSEAHLFTLQGETLKPIHSFDRVPGRESWYSPGGDSPDVRSMSIDPAGTVYVNVHVGGVVRSTDGGRSWEPTIDVHADVHQVLFDPGSGLVLAASARGLAVSDDNGDSWRFDTTGLHGSYLRAVAVTGRTMLVTVSTGASTNHAAVYRKPLDSSESFERCRQGLPERFFDNINTFCLVASGSWVAFGTSEGKVFLSSDQGQSWYVAAEGLPRVRCVALA